MVRGILMSKDGQKAILLTKDGSFQKVRLKKDAQVKVGQSVLDSDIALRPAVAKKIPMTLAACLTVVLVFGIISGFVRNNAIAAYVSFDVNPSIEAAVNRDFRIVNVKGLNEEGKALLENGIDYKNMSLGEFSLAIADAMSERGYLADEPDIVVSAIVTDKVKESNRDNFLTKINSAVNKVKNNQAFKKSNGSLEVINTTMDRRQEATKAGISTGKYMIYLKEEKGNGKSKGQSPLKLSQVKKMTVKEIKSHGKNKQDVVKTQKPKNFNNRNKKPDKKHGNEMAEQQNDGELLKGKAKGVNQTPNSLNKKGNPHSEKYSHPKNEEKEGLQNNSHNENQGNGNHKGWKNAG